MSVVVANELSKRYRLGTRVQHGSLAEGLARAAARPAQVLLRRRRGTPTDDDLWALRDVSFEIAAGETVGIIGRNGSGKSTLLKVLSRITRPTGGWVETRGRVGALLEVGTGFHPELTGRENVYLNGAILGMRRFEIQRRFDEIVDFAEVDRFLDTPVKRYSSGMRVRLAFAVAAHLEPEILIVDEVLAVGDLAFQRKCLGKMGEVTAEGRTVLFVSHNMAIVQTLCRRGIFLEGGSVVTDGPVDDTVAAYLGRLEKASATSLLERRDRQGRQESQLRGVAIATTHPSGILVTGSDATFTFEAAPALARMACAFSIVDRLGNPLMTFKSGSASPEDDTRPVGGDTTEAVFDCTVHELPLMAGRYRIDVALSSSGYWQDIIEGAAFFDVEDGVFRGRPVPADPGRAPVVVPHRWTVPTLDGDIAGDGGPIAAVTAHEATIAAESGVRRRR